MTRPDPISLRLPDELKNQLASAAATAGRSLNAEIRMRLEASLLSPKAKSVEERLASLEEEFADFKHVVEATYRRK